jgi:hypothetical protein
MLEYVHLEEYLPERKVPYMSFEWYKGLLKPAAKAMRMGATAARG